MLRGDSVLFLMELDKPTKQTVPSREEECLEKKSGIATKISAQYFEFATQRLLVPNKAAEAAAAAQGFSWQNPPFGYRRPIFTPVYGCRDCQK